jgi:hypothetical protein
MHIRTSRYKSPQRILKKSLIFVAEARPELSNGVMDTKECAGLLRVSIGGAPKSAEERTTQIRGLVLLPNGST